MYRTFYLMVTVLIMSLSTFVSAQTENEGVRDLLENMYVEPGHFTINSNSDTEVVDFDEPRAVRFCLNTSEHVTPLNIKYENKVKVLKPGNCMVVEAKGIAISAAGKLEAGWNLTGSYDVSR